jgi:putative ABC transport system permease protein
MKYLPLIFRNLLRNRRRTLLTILSIGVSIFIFAALISLPTIVNRILRDTASDLRVITHNKAGFSYSLPGAYETAIRAMPHVDAVTGYLVWIGSYRKPADTVVGIGVEPEVIRELWPDWGITKDEVDELERGRSGCIVAPELMKRFGWRTGDTITLNGSPSALELKIIGVFGKKGPRGAIVMRRDLVDEASAIHGRVILYWIKLDRSDSTPAVIDEIDSQFANSAFQTTTESEMTIGLDQIRTYRLMFAGAKILALVVVIVIGLVAANTAAMAVRERRKEMAVMRSLGFTRRMVVALMIAEGTLIGVAGGALGCILAFIALRLLPYAGSTLGPFVQILRLLPIVVAESFAIAAAIGLASAAVPVLSATRRDISSELRAT